MASPSGPKWLDVFDTPYGGGTSTAAKAVFLTFISLSLVASVVITVRTRRWLRFSAAMYVAYVLEITSYALRFLPWSFVTYAVNFSLSTIAPVFVTTAIHIATGSVLRTLGAEHALLSPNAHMRVFIWGDVTALLTQCAGLGLTFSGARGAGPWGLLLAGVGHTGQTVLFAGLLLQAVLLAAALALLAVAYARAGRADRRYGYTTFHRGGGPGAGYVALAPRFKVFLAVLPLAGACALARCAYRTAAAWAGVGGALARDEVAWLVAEGVLLTEALVTLAIFHPAVWVGDVPGGPRNNRNHNNNNTNNNITDGYSNIYSSGGAGAGGIDNMRTHAYDVESLRPSTYGTRASTVGKPGKRLSSGTTLTMTDMVETRGGMMHPAGFGVAPVAEDDVLLSPPPLYDSALIAPSEAGSSSESRRGSDGPRLLDVNPYYRYEDGLQTSPFEEEEAAAEGEFGTTSPYGPGLEEEEEEDEQQQQQGERAPRYSEDITAESRHLSPMEAEAEEDRLGALLSSSSYAFPRRQLSRNDSLPPRGGGGGDDDWEVESFVLPPRKPSTRQPGRGPRDDALEDAALSSTYSESLQPSRTGTLRAQDQEDWEVASFVLPPRMPSKRERPARGRREEELVGNELERSDSTSLYSQY